MTDPDRGVVDLSSMSAQLEWLIRSGAGHEMSPSIGADILDAIDAFLARFISYPNEHARHAHVLWIGHTWIMDVWDATPRLAFVSPEAGSGKTRGLTATYHLVPRPDLVGCLTPAALYRSIQDCLEQNGGRPTVLFDELDTVFGPDASGRGTAEIRRLVDIGHDQHATVARRIGQENQRFSPYCAMALAGKMAAADIPSTIRTRSIVIPMQRQAGNEAEKWRKRSTPAEAEPLRDVLQLWAEFVHARAHEYLPELPEEISGRDADCWEPLLIVADLAGGHWPETARVTAVTVVTASGMKALPSTGMQLLWDVKTVFDRCQEDHLFSRRLVAELKSIDESPWSALTAAAMAKLLSSYGVAPKLHRVGETIARGYRRGYFTDAWRRYPPPAPEAVTAVTTVAPGSADG
jgi:hypothetical protein